MGKLKRRYSNKTLKLLWGLSRGQCARPGCPNTLIAPRTDASDDLVVGEVCHILALSVDGPRGEAGLTEEELNSPHNLILLCRNDHAQVDGQHETYPAERLRRWKQQHEDRTRKLLTKNLEVVAPPSSDANFLISLVDQEIEKSLEAIKKGRFLQDFPRVERCLQLGRDVTTGQLAGGTGALRGRALAWCSRLLARMDEQDTAKAYLQWAKDLPPSAELQVALALLDSHEGNHSTAFRTLAALDSPTARSAALVVAADQHGSAGAVRWLEEAGLTPAALDHDGKSLLLRWLLELERWDTAWAILDHVTEADSESQPVLCHLTAVAELLRTVPAEYRTSVQTHVPFRGARSLPLASNTHALRARSLARQRFGRTATTARELKCPIAEAAAEEYWFWLGLRDPILEQATLQALEERLSNLAENLRLVPLGLQFGVQIDTEAVDQEIRQQIVREGGHDPTTVAARLGVGFTRDTPEEVADYLARHRAELGKHVDEIALRRIEVESLADAGRIVEAKKGLESLLNAGLSPAAAHSLGAAITRAEAGETTDSRRRRFEESDSLVDLLPLVEALFADGTSADLCKYSRILFERTGSLDHAEGHAKVLAEAQEYDRLAQFLKSNQDLVDQSDTLQLCLCWSLFYQGRLLEARNHLHTLSVLEDDSNYRYLRIQLAIRLGDWESLSAIIESEYENREDRDWQDLVGAAHLAVVLGVRRAEDLALAAARKAKENANAFAKLYELALKAGWDDEPFAGTWLNQAVTLSGPEGPVRRTSLSTLMNERPKWQERRVNLLKLLDDGEIPAFLAADALNKPLSSMMLLPALTNHTESDPRHRRRVLAYSGKRPQVAFGAGGQAGFDAASLLTLGLLDLLDEALDAFDTVHLPHSTLAWLFGERQNASFHQPRLVREARRVRKLLSQGRIATLEPGCQRNSALAVQVGDTLATLIAEAEASRAAGQRAFVVRPFPVYHVASLLEEEVDLTAHRAVLSSCQAIVDNLRSGGIFTDEQHKKASWQLTRNEQPWPGQPPVSAPASLYLDGLATTYFLQIGGLDVLADAGFTVFVTPATTAEADRLLAYDDLVADVDHILERIRTALSTRIADGRVQVGPVRPIPPSEGPDLAHPTVDLLELADRCDVVVTDDRLLNSHPYADGRSVPTLSTLDLLDTLSSSGAISAADRLTHRTRLRRFGYLFVPVERGELLGHLSKSTVKDGQVLEHADLKAVRESLLVARMGDCLQLPDESQWLGDTIGAFVAALKDLWLGDPTISDARARSDWILKQIDPRGWAHRLPPASVNRSMDGDRAEQLVRLMFPHSDASPTAREHYWDWVERRLLKPVQATEPALYSWLSERFLLTVSRVADQADEDGTRYDE